MNTLARLADGPFQDLVSVEPSIVIERLITTPGVKQLARKIVMTITRMTVKGNTLCSFNATADDESVIYHVLAECRTKCGKEYTQATFAGGDMDMVTRVASMKMCGMVMTDNYAAMKQPQVAPAIAL